MTGVREELRGDLPCGAALAAAAKGLPGVQWLEDPGGVVSNRLLHEGAWLMLGCMVDEKSLGELMGEHVPGVLA